MKVVDVAERAPRRCTVTGREDGPFVDFLTQIDPGSPAIPNNLYLRVAVVEEAAKALGMVPKAEVDSLRERLAETEEELGELRALLEAYGELEEVVSKIKERNKA